MFKLLTPSDTDQRLAEAYEDLDEWRNRAMAAEQDLAERTKERDQAEKALTERTEDYKQALARNEPLEDALHAANKTAAAFENAFLPLYGGPITPTTEPVGALIAEQLEAEDAKALAKAAGQ